MGEIKEFISEKSINYWIRLVLRIMAWVVMMFYMVFRILKPVINQERLHLDTNDGYIMMSCIALLLGIEAVKMAVDKWVSKQ